MFFKNSITSRAWQSLVQTWHKKPILLDQSVKGRTEANTRSFLDWPIKVMRALSRGKAPQTSCGSASIDTWKRKHWSNSNVVLGVYLLNTGVTGVTGVRSPQPANTPKQGPEPSGHCSLHEAGTSISFTNHQTKKNSIRLLVQWNSRKCKKGLARPQGHALRASPGLLLTPGGEGEQLSACAELKLGSVHGQSKMKDAATPRASLARAAVMGSAGKSSTWALPSPLGCFSLWLH